MENLYQQDGESNVHPIRTFVPGAYGPSADHQRAMRCCDRLVARAAVVKHASQRLVRAAAIPVDEGRLRPQAQTGTRIHQSLRKHAGFIDLRTRPPR